MGMKYWPVEAKNDGRTLTSIRSFCASGMLTLEISFSSPNAGGEAQVPPGLDGAVRRVAADLASELEGALVDCVVNHDDLELVLAPRRAGLDGEVGPHLHELLGGRRLLGHGDAVGPAHVDDRPVLRRHHDVERILAGSGRRVLRESDADARPLAQAVLLRRLDDHLSDPVAEEPVPHGDVPALRDVGHRRPDNQSVLRSVRDVEVEVDSGLARGKLEGPDGRVHRDVAGVLRQRGPVQPQEDRDRNQQRSAYPPKDAHIPATSTRHRYGRCATEGQSHQLMVLIAGAFMQRPPRPRHARCRRSHFAYGGGRGLDSPGGGATQGTSGRKRSNSWGRSGNSCSPVMP